MKIEIKPPQISENTMKEMAKFFMRTSIPRIIEAERKKKLEEIKTA
ncbi:hypothetical protein DFO70_1116 [Cytobacillus firmus]|uniref:Uncharacterized protein n=2 Tax=Cytobacillus TaxID=2675230 RepID=A0A366JN48_CYTFI|nr:MULTISPECIES: hypothetical protein [Cytobacillus]RBP89359.1 hypothetical protein DFO70_1116 [Cytobacillus firmus]TDX47414.1 hypothetical protein DFO72_101511 [Cytobacillus oceanisediminis]